MNLQYIKGKIYEKLFTKNAWKPERLFYDYFTE